MNPVNRVTIHHEGAGTPSDVARGAGGGYTYWLGQNSWYHLRPVWESYATLDFNHVSLDICFSGDRMVNPVSDHDVTLLRGIVNDARIRGYITIPGVILPHRLSPGSSTVCPGTNVMARWTELVACFQPAPPAPHPVVEEEMPSFPSLTKPSNMFRGAIVNLAAKHVDLKNAAVCNPAPVVANPNPWIAAYGQAGHFTIVTSDLDEYHFDLP